MTSPKAAKEKLGSLESGSIGVIFVGMSNVGKSYQTKKLGMGASEYGLFERVCVDDEIEAALAREFRKEGIQGEGIEAVAEWMGSPHADDGAARRRYAQREKTYLALENESYQQLLGRDFTGSWTIDTTGSFVHCSPVVQRQLADKGVVVYIEAAQSDMHDMLQSYLDKPKPVCWAGYYTYKSAETIEQSIERSYRDLLIARACGYQQLADVTIAKDEIRQTKDADKLLNLIKSRLG